MNKIFLYSLGAITWFSVLSVSAADMFEVLPDLPDPLAYAVQPAVAASVSGATDAGNIVGSQSIGQEPSLISVFLSLAFVVLLIYLTGILYTKLNKVGFKTLKKQQGELGKYQVSVVSTTQLGNNKTLHVVELDGKKMLIGASSGAIQLIKDLGSCSENDFDEDYSRIEIPNIKIPKIEIPKIEIPTIGFSKLVTKAHKGLNEIEQEQEKEKEDVKPENKDFDEEELVLKENISGGIIDTLFKQNEVENYEELEETNSVDEHIVDPDDFALYKKYLS